MPWLVAHFRWLEQISRAERLALIDTFDQQT